MKFSKSKLLVVTLMVIVVLVAICSSASADLISVTIQKWTASFGALSGSSSFNVYVDGNNGADSVSSFPGFGYLYPDTSSSTAFAADPFAGALDLTLLLGLDSASSGSSMLSSNLDVKKHGANDSTQYWIKIFVEDSTLSNPAGSPLTASTTYSQTLADATTGTLRSFANSNVIAPVTIPFSTTTNSVSFARSGNYDIKQEYDINLTATKTAHAEVLMTTVTVPEPSWTILSALLGLVPMGFVARSFRRKTTA